MQNRIKSRISTNHYSDMPLSDRAIADVKKIMLKPSMGPFGKAYNLRMIQNDFLKKNRIRRLAAYGTLSGKPSYVFAPINVEKYDMVDYGYCMQKLVLELTAKGLDTMWITTVLKKRQLKKVFHLNEGRDILAAVAIGNRKVKKHMTGHSGQEGHARKPFEDIFYNRSLNYPLSKDKAGDYLEALEAFRLSPSYNNLQRWVVVQDGLKYHFYTHGRKHKTMVNIDIGAAMYHFDAVRLEKGLEGEFIQLPNYKMAGYDYVASFVTKPEAILEKPAI